jgi:hypothetical protein
MRKLHVLQACESPYAFEELAMTLIHCSTHPNGFNTPIVPLYTVLCPANLLVDNVESDYGY